MTMSSRLQSLLVVARNWRYAIAMSVAFCWAVMVVRGQVGFTGTYSQNFDSLPTSGNTNTWTNNTTLPGWYCFRAGSNGTANTRDGTTTAETGIIADNGASTTGAIYSYGTGTNTDRALGCLGGGAGDHSISLVLRNDSAQTYNAISISYTGEQWRRGTANTAQTLVFDYAKVATFNTANLSASVTTGYTAVTSLNFAFPQVSATAASLDGNATANRAALSTTLTGLSWAPGEYLVLRWWDDRIANASAAAIDDITVANACTSPNVPTGASAYTTALGVPVTMSVSVGTNQTADWFTGSCGGTQVATGTTSLAVTPQATGTTTYYARARNTGSCTDIGTSCLTVALTTTAGLTDATVGGPTINGGTTPGTDEYGPGNSYQWKGSKGATSNFGGTLGDGTLYLKGDTSGPNVNSLTVGFLAGAAYDANIVVVLLDTKSGSAGATVSGNGDQQAIGRVLTNTNALTIFDPDYAVVFSGAGQALYQLNGGTAAAIGSFGSTLRQPGTTNTAFRELSIDYSLLGMSAGGTVKFLAALSSNDGYLSSESIPANGMTANPGYAANGAGTYSTFGQFTTYACAPVSITTQPTPASKTVCNGVGATYTVTGTGGSGTVTYLWRQSTDNFVSNDVPAAGTNTASSYSAPTGTVGTMQYRCVVSSTCGTPSSAVSNTVSLTVRSTPVTPFNALATPSQYCASNPPQTVTLHVDMDPADLASGVHGLWSTGACAIPPGTTVVQVGGSDVSIFLGPNGYGNVPTTPGTYTYYCRAYYNGTCSSSDCAAVTFTVLPSPSAGLAVAAASTTLCAGAGTTITVAGSQTGVSYQLRNSADNSAIGTPVSGTGATISLPTGNLSATTTFNVLATSGSCGSVTLTTTPTVTVIQPPSGSLSVTAQSLSICTGTSTNIVVAASQSGVTYQLRNNADNSNVGSPIVSSGGAINLPTGPLTASTTFNVLATASPCTVVQLSQLATVTVNPLPSVPSGQATYVPVFSTSVTLSVTVGANATADWTSGSCSGSAVPGGTGSTSVAVTAPALGASSTYYVKARDLTSGCTSDCFTVTVIGGSPVVISQVYGGGGNSSATYQNDFVELFNRSTAVADISGWSVQFAGTSSNFAAAGVYTFPSNTVIPAGSYLLVKSFSASATGSLLPSTSLSVWSSGTDLITASNGKVALANNTTPVSGSTGSNVMDFVGYGTANDKEGTAAAPAASATTAIFRKNNGCQDTNQNGTDFAAGTPRPRNSASPACNCSGGLTDTVIDASPSAPTLDGSISPSEYAAMSGTATFGGDGSSFGGMLGYFPNSSSTTGNPALARLFFKSDTTGVNIAYRNGFRITGASGSGANYAVLLLDTKPGGSTSSPSFADTGDSGRAAASRALRSSRPATFGVDYVLIFFNGGSGVNAVLFSFDGSALTPVSGMSQAGAITTSNSSNPASSTGIEVRIPYSLLGFTAGGNVDFIASLNNGNVSGPTMSDETVPVSPALSGAGNQDTGSGGTFTNYNRFTTYCPPPATNLTVAATDSSLCFGGSTTITLSNPETGVSYQLRTGTTAIGSAQTGAGSPLSFSTGTLSAGTTFNILATNTCGSVQLATTPAVAVVQPASASLSVAAATSPVCAGASTTITVSGTQSGVSYQLFAGATPIGSAQTGNGGPLSFATGPISSDTTFSIVATAAPCGPVTLSQTATVAVQPQPSGSATPASSSIYIGQQVSIPATINNGGAFLWLVDSGGTGTFTVESGTGSNASTAFTLATGVIGQQISLALLADPIGPCTGTATIATVNLTIAAPPCTPATVAGFSGPSTTCAGGGVTFSASGSGTPPFTYTFKKDGGTVQSGSANSYTISAAAAADAGSYTVVVSNDCNTSGDTSSPITLTVNPATTTTNPAGQAVCAGQPASFSVTAGGTGPFHYQWKHDGGNVGSDSPTYSIPAASSSDVGSYTCIVSGACGTATSAAATLAVTDLPAAPTSAGASTTTFCVGSGPGTITLTATGGSGGTLTWYAGGCGSGGVLGTGPSITISAPSASTTYYVRTESATCGNSACVMVDVTVHPLPNPPSVGSVSPVCSGTSATLSGTVGADETIDWYTASCGGTPAGTGSSVSVSPTTTTTYYARARNTLTGCVSASCTSVTVTVSQSPTGTLSVTATEASVCPGASTTIVLAAAETGVSYQLKAGAAAIGSPQTGAGGALSFSTGPISAGTTFSIEATRTPCPAITLAQTAAVAVNDVATTTDPSNSAQCLGSTTTFSVTAGGTSPYTYHWQQSTDNGQNWIDAAGTNIDTATMTTSGSAAPGTQFRCIVTGACGTATSNPATLTVNAITTTTSPSSQTVCSGSPATFTVTAGGTGPFNYQWKRGTTPVGTNSATLSIPSAGTGDQGSYTCVVTGACGVATSDAATLTLITLSPANGADISSSGMCQPVSGTITLTVANPGSGGPVVWYEGGCGAENGGTMVGTGNAAGTLTIPAPTTLGTHRYYPRVETPCGNQTCVTLTAFVVTGAPTPPTSATIFGSNPLEYCTGAYSTLTLHANGGSGATLRWYTGSCGGSLVAIGNDISIPAPTTPGAYTYYARWESGSCGVSSCVSVPVTVKSLATPPTATFGSDAWCSANAPATFTLSASGGSGDVLKWYSGSCGGTYVGSGSPLTIPMPTTTTDYYARWESAGCGVSACGPAVTMRIYQTPPNPTGATATATRICTGQPTTLSASGASGSVIVTWFANSCGGPSIGNGNLVVSPTTTTTYYAKLFNNNGNCLSTGCDSVTVTVDPLNTAPTSAAASPDVFCTGAPPAQVVLTASGGSGSTLTWHLGSCNGPMVGTGSPLPIAAPTTTTTYYASWENTSCGPSGCASVTVTVNASPVAPTSAASSMQSYCANAAPGTITLNASGGSGDTLAWYTGSCGGTPIGTGNALAIAAPTATTTYYARWETTACGTSTCAQTTVTVNTAPSAPVAGSNSSICIGGTATISATAGSGEAIDWYEGSCGGASIGTGGSLSVSPTSTTTYYAKARNTATQCVSAGCASVTVNVSTSGVAAAPASLTASDPHFCPSSISQITLTAVGGSGDTLEWFAGSCGGTPLTTGPATFIVVSAPSATTTYYARWTNACGPSACASTTVTIDSPPAAPTSASVTPGSVCTGFFPPSITLHATGGGGDGASLKWYSGSCGGTFVGDGNDLVIVPPQSSTTFYALWSSSCGNSDCATVPYVVTTSPNVTATVQLAYLTSGAFDRCITFDFYTAASCPNPARTETVTMHFASGQATTTFQVPCDTYTCITARDGLHTLTRTADSSHIVVNGADLSVAFTGPKALLSGNINNDQFIDILDFGGFISRINLHYASPSTPCGYTVSGAGDPRPSLHADFSGNGTSDLVDFTFISTQLFAASDPTCCSNPATDEQPTLDISVYDLAARGDADSWDIARTADLNRDGRINFADVDFMAHNGLTSCPADFDGLDGPRVQDIFAYLTAWFAGHPATDFDGNRRVEVADIFVFLNDWFTGCP